MKSFKVLMFLTLAAALSCGANGSPTNVTTDGYPTTASKVVLKGIMDSLQSTADLYFKKYSDYADFTKAYVDRLAWVRPYNYVVCSVKHTYKFDGVKGVDWNSGWVYDNTRNIGIDPGGPPSAAYEVVVGGSGSFTRQGKGGYKNWAWNGFNVWNQDLHSNIVTFYKPPAGRQQEGGGD